jgi:hypothetical protein
MLRVARRKQQLLAAQRLQRGREIDAARLHVDRLDVQVRGQQAVERARRHVALPARRNLQQRERRILLQAGAERLGAVAPVDGSQIAHDLHDLARLHVLADVLAGFFAVSVIVGAHDHRHVALGGRDVHGHDLHVLLRGVVERALMAAESIGPTTMPFAPRFTMLFMSVICCAGSLFELTGARISIPSVSRTRRGSCCTTARTAT